jgi:thioredoxin-related protein
MTEEEFYKKKIFEKIHLKQLNSQFPNLKDSIKQWYKSDRYNKIQDYKSFLTNKINQMNKNGSNISLSNEQLYNLFIWWENTPKVCYYCSLPENTLEEIHQIPGHINKRYPQRGKSLEIDRKQSDLPYSNIENLALSCYWCNNAKTDTFTETEFEQIGQVIKRIWENRLGRNL